MGVGGAFVGRSDLGGYISMFRRGIVALGTVLALGLTACSSETDGNNVKATPVPVASASESASPTPTPEPTAAAPTEDSVYGAATTSARGYLVKNLGQLAGATTPSGDPLVQFSVTAIQPNFECTSEYAQPSQNGNFIALTLDIQTTAELAQNEEMPFVYFQAFDFRVIGPDGTRENDSSGNGSMCLDSSEASPSQIGPGEHVVATVVLDSKYTTGAIVYVPSWMNPPSGWEWVF